MIKLREIICNIYKKRQNPKFRMKKLTHKWKLSMGAVSLIAMLLAGIVCFGCYEINRKADIGIAWKVVLVNVYSFCLVGALSWHFECYSFRFIPAVVVACAWLLLFNVAFSAALSDSITLVHMLKYAYEKGKFGTNFIKNFLSFFTAGVFGSIVIIMGTEAAKDIWNNEFRTSENKHLLSQFRRARRKVLLTKPINKRNTNINILYLHVIGYMLALVVCASIAMSCGTRDSIMIRIDLALLLFSVALEFVGVFSYLIITEDALNVAEKTYLNWQIAYVEKR